MIGFLNVFKPAGPTSHDVVAAVRRALPRGVKVGHCGTLDPFAEGVLVVCVGAATRLASYVQAQPKRYAAQVTLGASSTTDDPTGTITPGPVGRAYLPDTQPTSCGDVGQVCPTYNSGPTYGPPTDDQVRAAAARFVGEIRQRPPAHSAVHVEGQRAYKLARRGHDVELPERTVTVYVLAVLRYEYPLLELDIRCGGGTYVRALARDLGAALGSAGYCSRLLRTEIGAFHADAALRLDASLRAIAPGLAKRLIAPVHALGEMPRVILSDSDCQRVRGGKSVEIPRAIQSSSGPAANASHNPNAHRRPPEGIVVPQSATDSQPSTECAVLDPLGNLLAIAENDADGGLLRPRIVLSA